jgi:hypothetical protein
VLYLPGILELTARPAPKTGPRVIAIARCHRDLLAAAIQG